MSERDRALVRLREMRSLVADIEGVDLRPLLRAIERLEQKSITIAVFGAFSAGKSSLLNALLGRPLLAVSPQPTTAAITSVRPADGGRASVRITAKSRDELWQDVRALLDALGQRASDLDDAVRLASGLSPAKFPIHLRRHVRFLKALAEGYPEMGPRMGEQWEVSLEELRDFSADEKRAAYVSQVDVWADSRLGERGFIFVDTPGVDSIHRRHTNVAFQYMREADAIVFVMYYTHAFSQADREFLLQLSGVQDVAGTNKLFSVVNAVDLAESEEELAAVLERVSQDERKLGVREPRVYPVSAQLALAARVLATNPHDELALEMARARLGRPDFEPTRDAVMDLERRAGLAALEADLTDFCAREADRLALDLVERTRQALVRDVEALLEKLTIALTADQAARDAERAQIARARGLVEEAASSVEARALPPLARELEELLFHAGERVRFAYRDMFREAFHPGRFRLGNPQDKLREAAREFAETLSRRLEIELRTFALRAEQLAAKAAGQEAARLAEGWPVHAVPVREPDVSLDLATADEVISFDEGVLAPHFRHFRSPKQFFEEGGQTAMMDAAMPAVMDQVKRKLEESGGRVAKRAEAALAESLRAFYADLVTSLDALAAALDQPVDPAERDRLAAVLASLRSAAGAAV
ncbi:dynamin family protein [Alicyclobacillus sendaiensis]|uniref:Dynamin family protein n=1 Tax=Alicyclobacillus sendaiensis PA2 TaxID=3029425 RepID=A0ABT6XYN2_ALISE|nr:dynamin family protein [Alicyclobacillus sendaiensis]MDI9260201.1 dynamin family protein [Alicyclobacillus sendaiensis PA2]